MKKKLIKLIGILLCVALVLSLAGVLVFFAADRNADIPKL